MVVVVYGHANPRSISHVQDVREDQRVGARLAVLVGTRLDQRASIRHVIPLRAHIIDEPARWTHGLPFPAYRYLMQDR